MCWHMLNVWYSSCPSSPQTGSWLHNKAQALWRPMQLHHLFNRVLDVVLGLPAGVELADEVGILLRTSAACIKANSCATVHLSRHYSRALDHFAQSSDQAGISRLLYACVRCPAHTPMQATPQASGRNPASLHNTLDACASCLP